MRGDVVICADLSVVPVFDPFVAEVIGVNGDSVDVRRIQGGEIEPMDGAFVWRIAPFMDIREAEGEAP